AFYGGAFFAGAGALPFGGAFAAGATARPAAGELASPCSLPLEARGGLPEGPLLIAGFPPLTAGPRPLAALHRARAARSSSSSSLSSGGGGGRRTGCGTRGSGRYLLK